MIGLTQAQAHVLALLEASEATGVCPSFEEMKQECGLRSKSEVSRILTTLEEKGRIRRLRRRARAIEVVRNRPPLENFTNTELLAELAQRMAANRRAA